MAKYLCIWVRAYWFSVTSFSKWLPGGHIRFFGFWMAWFRQRNSSLLWNFSFKFHVHVLCGCRQKPNDCQLCRFQNGCLVILNNVTYLLWSGGILVDHWSTISSWLRYWLVQCKAFIWITIELLSIGPYAEQNSVRFTSKFGHFHSRKYIWKCPLQNGNHFVSALIC